MVLDYLSAADLLVQFLEVININKSVQLPVIGSPTSAKRIIRFARWRSWSSERTLLVPILHLVETTNGLLMYAVECHATFLLALFADIPSFTALTAFSSVSAKRVPLSPILRDVGQDIV
jgi:hypothetical protein